MFEIFNAKGRLKIKYPGRSGGGPLICRYPQLLFVQKLKILVHFAMRCCVKE